MRTRKISSEILPIPRRETEPQTFFSVTAHLAMRFCRHRRQAFDQLRPHRAEFRPMFDQRRIVGCDLAGTRMRRFQERIPGAKRPFVRAKGRPVKRIDLGGEKIQVAPPRIGSAPHQLDVGIGKRNDSTEPQIFGEGPLLDLIQRNLSAQSAVTKFQPMIAEPPRDPKRLLAEANHRRERGVALRLQPQKNAGRLQDRRFPLPVSCDEKIEAGRELDRKRLEAAEIPELKFGEHEIQSAL
jgi:hypothetical protein